MKMRHPMAVMLLVGVLAAGGVQLGLTVVRSPDIGLAVVVSIIIALFCLALITQQREDRQFLVRLFLLALCLRWLVGWIIYYKGLGASIGPDFMTYDYFGNEIYRSWQGLIDPGAPWLTKVTAPQRSGWGMYYYVAAIYYLLGRNLLVIQLINCIFGAVACILVYQIAYMVYPRLRVARLAGILTAVAPSTVLWSSQGLKESPIMLCLCLCTFLTLRLCRKIRVLDFVFLLISLFCLYSLRHYVFYILFLAIAGALLFSAKKYTLVRAIQGGLLVIMLGLAFAYFGAGEVAEKQFNLKRIQEGREWGSKAANSGYGSETDVTDTRAALTYLPLGVLYVLFAPFPWMIRNMIHLVTLPEMIIWWLSAPLLVKGYWFALRRRLRDSFAICLFTIGLTLVYALFQSNFGTAHRQRAQLFVFFFVFISIGWELRREERLRRARSNHLGAPPPKSVPAYAPAGAVHQQLRQAPTR